MTVEIVLWALAAVVGLAGYTILYEYARHNIRRRFARRWRRSLGSELRARGGALERFPLLAKELVRLELLGDLEIHEAMMDLSRSTGRSLEEIRDDVDDYVDEIVPAFNLVSFYQVAYRLGRALLSMAYQLAVDEPGLERIRKLPPDASVVFIFNHRSNADFMIANTIFARRIALSFAVGEWARVWPLDVLFRSFGSFFVRRGFRDELYHKVLERYVQYVTRAGQAQGFFIEGALSRDGRLREPKIGMLSYILGAKRDPRFRREILIVPVGLGFDRVVEDFRLLAEARGGGERRGFLVRMFSLILVLGTSLGLAFYNLIQMLRGRWRRFGHAAIAFGEPISADRWLASQGDLWKIDPQSRKQRLKDFAHEILATIGRVVPATPVPIVARALLSGPPCDVHELARRVGETRRALVAVGAPVLLGDALSSIARAREERARARDDRNEEVAAIEENLLDVEENERIAEMGLALLAGRRFARRRRDGVIEIRARRREYVEYYANMIGHHFAARP